MERAARVTGLPLQELQTCPRWYAAQPIVKEITRARKWADRGVLAERYGGEIPSFVFEAVDVLDDACADREAEDAEALRKKTAEPPTPPPPPGARRR